MVDVSKLFKDSDGKVIIGQLPNIPISLWFGLTVLSVLASGRLAEISSTLAQLFLFAWAYLELVSGVSLFRKLLGLVVITYIFIRIVF